MMPFPARFRFLRLSSSARMPWSVNAFGAILVVVALDLGGVGFGRVSAQGETSGEPVPLAQAADVGPWQMTVEEVVTGQEAADRVVANGAIGDDGGYVIVRLTVRNASDQPLAIDSDDFGATGPSGLVRRFAGVLPPDPALAGIVEPGETKDGWIAVGAPGDDEGLLLLYDSLSISGAWADRVFALQDGAAAPNAAEPAAQPNGLGKESAAPAAPGEAVTTADWQVEVLDVVRGQAVPDLFPASDYRTTALVGAGGAVDSWRAVRVRVTNVRTGDEPAFLPPSAFAPLDADGNVVPDVLLLTPPSPDASGSYFPGAAREGWFAFEAQPGGYSGVLRFLPYSGDPDPRYLALDADAATGAAEPAEPNEESDPAPDRNFSVDVIVTTTDDGVRLRAEPSADAEIVAELDQGIELRVTGPAEEGDGFTWYPVERVDDGEGGYVAQDFLEAEAE